MSNYYERTDADGELFEKAKGKTIKNITDWAAPYAIDAVCIEFTDGTKLGIATENHGLYFLDETSYTAGSVDWPGET